MTRRIAILGSTGSIGKNALKVISALGPEYSVTALSAHNNIELLETQARICKPKLLAVTNPARAQELKERVKDMPLEVLAGPDGLTQAARDPECDTVLTAVVGAVGLPSTLAAAQSGKRLAIANKEPLVMAGELLTTAAKTYGSTLLPIDSEHSAVFQALQSGRHADVHRIILTASGGPFRLASAADLQTVTPEQALLHPTWDMGPKITIDSATMMNKALEIIEAHWLFDMPVSQIDVLIHPESVIHSLVEFVDGAVIAQMGTPDMCLPIQYALTYPERLQGISEHLKLEALGHLTFESPNHEVFRALDLAYNVAATGGTAPAVFNAANETAVAAFLSGTIKFTQITELVEHCLDEHDIVSDVSLDAILNADAWARDHARKRIGIDSAEHTTAGDHNHVP